MNYAKPPITEAVLELRFDRPLSASHSKSLRKKLLDHYPNQNLVTKKQFSVETISGKISETAEEQQYRLSNEQETRLILIGDNTLAISHLAPYDCWNSLRNNLNDVFNLDKKISGYRKITRYGMRYINRLDLKLDETGSVNYEDYLNLRIHLPENFYDLLTYNLKFACNLHDLKATATVSSAVADSVIIGHGAFYLDIDISSTSEIPQKTDDLFIHLDKVRDEKNKLFELFITDRARELFNA